MKLECVMMSEISQSQKDCYCVAPRDVRLVETKSGVVVSRGGGVGSYSVGPDFQFRKIEKSLFY